jgi:hypothetical protein
VTVYELVGEAAALSAGDRASLAAWEAAVADHGARRFDAACRGFEALAAARPDDALAAVWAARAGGLAAAPPAPDWDGIHALAEK